MGIAPDHRAGQRADAGADCGAPLGLAHVGAAGDQHGAGSNRQNQCASV